MKVKSIPIRFSWGWRWDKNDAHFYIGKSWEADVKRLDGQRVSLYSTRIQLGPLRIMLGTYGHEGFEQIAALSGKGDGG